MTVKWAIERGFDYQCGCVGSVMMRAFNIGFVISPEGRVLKGFRFSKKIKVSIDYEN